MIERQQIQRRIPLQISWFYASQIYPGFMPVMPCSRRQAEVCCLKMVESRLCTTIHHNTPEVTQAPSEL